MDDEELRKLYEDAHKVKISMPETQPTMGNMKPFETQLAGTLLQTPKAPAPEEASPYEGAKAYIQKLIDSAGSRQAETVRDEKLARAQEAVLGIGDMGRALANMFAATQYAPNGFQDSGLSDKARERAERAKAERDKHRDELLNYHMAIGKMNENERSWKHQREMAKERLALQQQKQQNADELLQSKIKANEARENYYKALENKNDKLAEKYYYDAIYAEARAKYIDQHYTDRHAESLAKQDADRALAEYRREHAKNNGGKNGNPYGSSSNNNNSGGTPSNSGGSGGKGSGSLLPNKPQQSNPAGSLLPNKKQ